MPLRSSLTTEETDPNGSCDTLSFPVKMADGVYKALDVRPQQQGRVHAPGTVMARRLAFMLALAVALRVTETESNEESKYAVI